MPMNESPKLIEVQPNQSAHIHCWEPAEPAAAIVLIVHGLGEHGGRYASLAETFVDKGILVYAFDQQGHGLHPGKRGCIESYSSLLDDIEGVLRWIAKQHPEQPVVLLGHSMGGNLSINFALKKLSQGLSPTDRIDWAPRGVIASSPMIRSSREPGKLFEAAARLLLLIAPNYRLVSEIIPERLMTDPIEQQRLANDKMFHSKLSLRLGGSLLDTGRWALDNAGQLAVPLLLTHGTDDYLTSPQASEEFARRAGELCRLELLPGQKHDPFRDLERDAVVNHFVDFILEAANKA